ncbi:MAG: enoyl-CoA hydratase/isomerase family protein [Deltaproteobacteria bacterium]|nr:enoyl-CoA hydratase/isomerase family protein [Deltaproteobacteria bacterium]
MKTLTLTKRGDGVAVLLFDTPKRPVNVLSQGMLEEAGPLMEEIQDDDEIVACVLASGKADSFIAGADLDQVVGMTAAEAEAISRGGHEWLDRVDKSRKPFVAAIHGAALGGGLEVALACHYRIATDHPKTVLALPEVMLGVLPAAGGTQRLPRLIGLQRALPMLLTGKRVRAARAVRHGLVDALTSPGGLVETAAKAALGLANGTLKPNRDKQPLIEKPLALPPVRAWALGKARDEVMKKTRGLYPAPLEILACVAKGLADGTEAGQEEEAVRFGKLVGSVGAKNLIRLFDAMTALKKAPKGDEPKAVKRLGVLGAGLMGEGIAAVSLALGPVVLKDVSDEGLSRATRNLRKGLDRRVRSGGLTRLDRDRQWFGLRPTARTEDLAGCDLVIEAVFEDLALKRKVLAEVEAVLAPDAVFASNTSALPIAQIAARSKRPERVVGMHYFSPVPKMPLLEIVVAEKTAPWAVATARAFGVAQGKTVLVVKDGPGFYTTRILGPFINEAVVLLDEGAAIPALDAALLDFGFPVGPVALLDEVGIDVAAHVSRDLGKAFAARGAAPSATFTKLFDAGYRGRKNAKGFYLYPKDRAPQKSKEVNPEVYSFFGGASRKAMVVGDLVDRLSLLMVNEAVWCLSEGVIASPRDGDAGAILGLGFPPFRGGPFRHVDAVGAAKVVARMEELAERHGPRFHPAPMLVQMARAGKRFHG